MGCGSDRSDTDLPRQAQPVIKRHVCHYEGCGAAFMRPYRLRAHLQLHEGKKQFKCDVDGCEKSYTNNAHLKRHVTTTHQKADYVPVFICQEPGCLRHLSSDSNLRRHHQQVHSKPYVCDTCSACFNKHNKLANHVASHTNVRAFKCDVCDVSCATSYDLKRHARGHKTYACSHPGCEGRYDTWSQLRKHYKLEHPHQYKCSDCCKVFTSKPQLRAHVEVHLHPLKREVLHCPHDKCPRFYFHKKNLTHHIKSSHEGRRHPCDEPGCERTFCSKRKMMDHKKLHDPGARLPRRRCKSRRKRKDAGKPKRSVAAKLSGVSVPYQIEKSILERVGALEDLLAAEGTSGSRGDELCAAVAVESGQDVHEAQAGSVARSTAERVCVDAGSSVVPGLGCEPCSVPTVNVDVNSSIISSPEASVDTLADRGGPTTTEQVPDEDSNLQMLLQCARSLANNSANTSGHETSDWRQRSSAEVLDKQLASESERRKYSQALQDCCALQVSDRLCTGTGNHLIAEDHAREDFSTSRTKVGSTTSKLRHSGGSMLCGEPDMPRTGLVRRARSAEREECASVVAVRGVRDSGESRGGDGQTCVRGGTSPLDGRKCAGQGGLLGGSRGVSVPTQYVPCVRQSKRRRRRASSQEVKLQLPRLFSVVNTREWLSSMLLAMRLVLPEVEHPV